MEEDLAAAQVAVRVAEAARGAVRDSIWDRKVIVSALNVELLHRMNRDIPAMK